MEFYLKYKKIEEETKENRLKIAWNSKKNKEMLKKIEEIQSKIMDNLENRWKSRKIEEQLENISKIKKIY